MSPKLLALPVQTHFAAAGFGLCAALQSEGSHGMKLGAHMSTSGGVWKALQRGVEIGCEVVQIFVKNNVQWLGKPFRPSDLRRYRAELAASGLDCVFGHAGYLIKRYARGQGKSRDPARADEGPVSAG
ncbi:MAG: hypothetical protein E6L09_03630 [Verrucomicrobia bacterium]|nr:MAG: hypothetical protein E6L09_03630 [Verrucomicrobiota bacterium]